jgi:hypothetical protein
MNLSLMKDHITEINIYNYSVVTTQHNRYDNIKVVFGSYSILIAGRDQL